MRLDFRQRGRVSVEIAPILGDRKEETVDHENCRDHDYVILAKHLLHLDSKFSDLKSHVGDVTLEFCAEVGDFRLQIVMDLVDLKVKKCIMKLEVGFRRDVFPNAGW